MITDEPQPQPGPSPTPRPKPTAALKIISISSYSQGRGILTLPAPFGELLVSKDYMQECQPEVGGFYCISTDMKFFLSAADYEDRFPQS